MFAQLLEARTDLQVERRLGLAGTQFCFEALRTGAIDLYPEYTGTGLVSILGEKAGGADGRPCAGCAPSSSPAGTSGGSPRSGSRTPGRSPCRRSWPSARSLRTISDLARISGRLRGGFGHEFVGREDGLLGLERTYGLRFASVQPLQQALQYQAAGDRRIDAMDAYTTDARLLRYRLVVLDDDKGFFPPYDAAPLVRGATLARHPEIGRRPRPPRRRLRRGPDARPQLPSPGEGRERDRGGARRPARARPDRRQGRDAPEKRPARRPASSDTFRAERSAIGRRTLEHLGLSALALALGVLVAVPLGLWLERTRRGAEAVIRLLGLFQTDPVARAPGLLRPLPRRRDRPRPRRALALLALSDRPQHLHRRAGRRPAGRRSRHRAGHDARPGAAAGPPAAGRPDHPGRESAPRR